MRAFIFLIAAAILISPVVLPSHAQAQSDPLTARSWQLLSGQDYLELAEYDRDVYISGINDAYNWSFVAGFQRMKWLIPCVHGRKPEQLSAMFSKWLQENPERWHEPAAKLFPFAMFSACRKPGRPEKLKHLKNLEKPEKPKTSETPKKAKNQGKPATPETPENPKNPENPKKPKS